MRAVSEVDKGSGARCDVSVPLGWRCIYQQASCDWTSDAPGCYSLNSRSTPNSTPDGSPNYDGRFTCVTSTEITQLFNQSVSHITSIFHVEQ